MRLRASIAIALVMFVASAHAESVAYDLPALAITYPNLSSITGVWSGCVPLVLAEAPTQVVAATFVAEGAVTPGVPLCPDQPAWGMVASAVLFFASSGQLVQSSEQVFDGPMFASFDLPIDVPVWVEPQHEVWVCFSLRPVHPVCLGNPFPSGTLTVARLVVDLASVEVAEKTWGAIKALYR